jgi:hypothetical protein
MPVGFPIASLPVLSKHFINSRTRLSAARNKEIQMQKAHLYEAILLVNRGVDEAVRGLECLKRAKDSQLNPSCFDEELVLFEDHRARLNSYFCSALQRSELQDSRRFGTRHREYEKNNVDEVQVYRDVRVVEDRRRVEGKPPKVRFFTPEEQHEWERRYPKPGSDVPQAEAEASQ